MCIKFDLLGAPMVRGIGRLKLSTLVSASNKAAAPREQQLSESDIQRALYQYSALHNATVCY
jgi:hypothetical protein